MSETIEQITIRESALAQTLESSGASLVEREGWRVAESFGDEAAEYRAVRDGGAGLVDLTSRGRTEVSGAEAVQFLNGLITNDVKALPANQWMPAAFPNVQGRLIAQARVLRQSDQSFLIDTESLTHERVWKTLGRFTLAGDFRVTDRTNDLTLLSMQGARSAAVIGAVLGEEAARTERNHITYAASQGIPTTLIRATHTGEDGFDLFVEANSAPSLWNRLVEAGARPVGFGALDVLRIEAGLPRYGVDMDESNIVLEAGLDEAVSYTKGCYIGQEIIARIHWRGHVARRLAGLIFDEDGKTETLDRDAKVKREGKDIGRITSSVYSPHLNRLLALSYIKYNYLAPGTEVQVVSGEREQRAHVAELPFVRGSWTAASSDS